MTTQGFRPVCSGEWTRTDGEIVPRHETAQMWKVGTRWSGQYKYPMYKCPKCGRSKMVIRPETRIA